MAVNPSVPVDDTAAVVRYCMDKRARGENVPAGVTAICEALDRDLTQEERVRLMDDLRRFLRACYSEEFERWSHELKWPVPVRRDAPKLPSADAARQAYKAYEAFDGVRIDDTWALIDASDRCGDTPKGDVFAMLAKVAHRSFIGLIVSDLTGIPA